MITNIKMTQEEAQELMTLVDKLWGITGGSKIIPADKADEVAALEKELAEKLLTHAPELVGCWVATREEYEPLLRSLAGVFRRIAAMTVPPRAQECHCKKGN